MTSSKSTLDLSYSPIEISSYLPSGWSVEAEEGKYEPERKRWRIEVQDVSELVSTLAVAVKEADRVGRIPALREAIDRLVRKA